MIQTRLFSDLYFSKIVLSVYLNSALFSSQRCLISNVKCLKIIRIKFQIKILLIRIFLHIDNSFLSLILIFNRF